MSTRVSSMNLFYMLILQIYNHSRSQYKIIIRNYVNTSVISDIFGRKMSLTFDFPREFRKQVWHAKQHLLFLGDLFLKKTEIT